MCILPLAARKQFFPRFWVDHLNKDLHCTLYLTACYAEHWDAVK